MEYPGDGVICVRGYADDLPWIWVGPSVASHGMIGAEERPIGWINTGKMLVLLDLANKCTIGRFDAGHRAKPVASSDGTFVHWVVAADGHWIVRSVDRVDGTLVERKIDGPAGWHLECRHLTCLADGRLRLLTTETQRNGAKPAPVVARVLTIDPSTGDAAFAMPINTHFAVPVDLPIGFSPLGTYVLTGWINGPMKLCTLEPPSVVRKLPAMVTIEMIAEQTIVVWQADESAFWTVGKGETSCIGVDGTCSPAIRRGDSDNDFDITPSRIVPLDGRRARLTFPPLVDRDDKQTAMFTTVADGQAADRLYEPRYISPEDGTDSGPAIYCLIHDRPLCKLISQTRRDKHTVPVPLTDLDPASRIAALDTLAKVVGDHAFWQQRKAEGFGDWRFAFEMRVKKTTKRIDEAKFFKGLIDEKLVDAVPALQRVMTAYLATLPEIDASRDHPYYDGEDGIAALAHALRALLELDAATDSPRHRATRKLSGDERTVTIGILRRYLETLGVGHATRTHELIGVDPG